MSVHQIHLKSQLYIRFECLFGVILDANFLAAMLLNTLRLALAKEDAAAIAAGEVMSEDTSPSAFIQAGLDLEEQQYVVL